MEKEQLKKEWQNFIKEGLIMWTPKHIENWWINKIHNILLENKRLKRKIKFLPLNNK